MNERYLQLVTFWQAYDNVIFKLHFLINSWIKEWFADLPPSKDLDIALKIKRYPSHLSSESHVGSDSALTL